MYPLRMHRAVDDDTVWMARLKPLVPIFDQLQTLGWVMP